MAMPTSGSIAIISAPQTCGSICAAVGTASGSLSTLSVAAGKIAPHCMREFYGYSSVTPVNFIQYAATGTYSVSAYVSRSYCISPQPAGAGSYTVCITGRLLELFQSFGSWSRICVMDGTTQRLCACCLVGGTPPVTTCVSFASTSANKVCVIVDACARCTACKGGSNAAGGLTITGTGYELGTTCTCAQAISG